MRRWAVLAECGFALLAVGACRKSGPPAEAVASASAAPATASVVSAVPSAAPAPNALTGSWSGVYRAEHHPVQMDRKEALPAWAKDDQKLGVGEGKLELVVDPNGSVSGTSTGPLGDLVGSGRAEEGTVRATLVPRDPSSEGAFQGTFVGRLTGDRIAGQLQVSSGDGAIVRRASVDLGRRR
jgi:hypothetical protein